MNAAQIHLLFVHLPVVGCPLVLLLMLISYVRQDDFLFKISCGFLAGCVVTSLVAYFSGPPSYELLKERYDVDLHYLDQHAVIARATFFGMILLGAGILSVGLQYLQEEQPGKWLRIGLIIATLLLCYLLAWSAHLGGLIRHPEIREPAMWIFPELPR